eukprot:CAMPEP_0198256926 /NCGR_PEP_ID=MMETSP1447-20131203/6719_1 /TAXON_ID=420782 /ORGANISM="Chaetoceros dichaeta, Strain CCMP1751" /LENGTH=405 /DNA_ID=CAMNT_0043943685 /DNA_START=123 /DNA_END=1340 /DNA_ORIENTATION=-
MRSTIHITPSILLLLLLNHSNAFSFPNNNKNKAIRKAVVVAGGGAAAIAAGIGVSILQKQQTKEDDDNYSKYNPIAGSLCGKTIVITGGSSGLGLESAKRLALAGANIVVTTRTDAKGETAVEGIRSYVRDRKLSGAYTDQTISYKLLNLDDLTDMSKQLSGSSNGDDSSSSPSSDWNDIPQIDVLLNNAGVMALPTRELTVDGIERQMQSNHLGHFALTAMLANSQKFSAAARIINVSSSAHTITKSIKWEYVWSADDGYGPWTSYGQSKLANVHFTTELQRRIDAAGLDWVTATLHPGVVATDLGRNMMGDEWYDRMSKDQGGVLESIAAKGFSFFLKTVESGASTSIWLASGAEDQDVRGKYFDNCIAQELSASAMDEDDAARLWRESEKLAGVTFNLNEVK